MAVEQPPPEPATPATGEPAASVDTSLQDLVVPMIPGVVVSLVLEGISALPGTVKIGLAALLSVGLWWFTGRRRAPAAATTAPGAPVGPDGAPLTTDGSRRPGWRRHWHVVLLAVVVVAVAALLVTRYVFGRPTIATAFVAATALAVTATLAYGGRRTAGAVTASIAGGLLGLCLGIALL